MRPRVDFIFGLTILIALVAGVPALAQVEPSATGNAGGSLDAGEMMTPPPLSGVPYADTASSDARSNYLATELDVSPAYIDNVLPGSGTSVGAITYSINPGVSFDRTSTHQQEHFSYRPSFTFYESTGGESTSALDSIDHNAEVGYQFRFNPEVSISAQDRFTRTSDVYDSNLLSNSSSGSTAAPTPTVIAPFEQQLVNIANGIITYQFEKNAMIGGGGSFIIFNLPNSSGSTGLYNSNNIGGRVFYSGRLSRSQYFGLTYQYAHIVASGANETQTHTLLPFYTFYFNQAFSVSLGAGIEHVDTTAPASPPTIAWSPTVTASIGWQGRRGEFSGSFTHDTIAGEGLLGTYNSNGGSASAGWKLARTWTGEVSFGYSSIVSGSPLTVSSVENGTTLTAMASVQHTFNDHLSAQFQYQHIHENYSTIAVIAADPDSNRESVTISYHLSRPVGR